MKKKEIPYIFYLYLHSKIWEMSKGRLISEKELKQLLFQWKIPNKLKVLIIKELIILGLLQKEKKYLIRINRPKFNIENINKYYQMLKIF